MSSQRSRPTRLQDRDTFSITSRHTGPLLADSDRPHVAKFNGVNDGRKRLVRDADVDARGRLRGRRRRRRGRRRGPSGTAAGESVGQGAVKGEDTVAAVHLRRNKGKLYDACVNIRRKKKMMAKRCIPGQKHTMCIRLYLPCGAWQGGLSGRIACRTRGICRASPPSESVGGERVRQI